MRRPTPCRSSATAAEIPALLASQAMTGPIFTGKPRLCVAARREPPAGRHQGSDHPERRREFASDSPLEESGFEPLVPLAKEILIELTRGITNPTRMLAVGDIGPVPRLC
jgi:hypothetical protein